MLISAAVGQTPNVESQPDSRTGFDLGHQMSNAVKKQCFCSSTAVVFCSTKKKTTGKTWQ